MMLYISYYCFNKRVRGKYDQGGVHVTCKGALIGNKKYKVMH